ncbi:saccharopine dehydrogenase NADP-binding domain-containing protein [Bacillus mesophilum]|uniref:Saccharopine dehydrogenase NADP binding domain-containing protein n=1 Tax=Bacillus mesophilum TaxID=1071718 RepID=A0A7V7RK87_9BACI|nr:saccharopine dehydrogenase NADP-binding domain-containing protein [Bacillus mesophilum]KAB2331669.1 hypothetical protein F7732_13395 [Bacillus mesophilum]
MKNIMVVGASGALGRLVCNELQRLFDNQIKLIVTDYKMERGKRLADSFNSDTQFRYLNVDDVDNVKQVIKDVDLVVVILKQKIPAIQKACIENKIICIDVTPFYDFAEKVMDLDQGAIRNNIGSVIMSGFFPGLSGLMIKKAIMDFQEVTEVNMALLQNTNASVGVTGIVDMLNIISQPVTFHNEIEPGFTKKRKMHFVNHSKGKRVRLIDHSEIRLIHDKLINVQLYYWTSWNNNIFNSIVSLLNKMDLLKVMQKADKKLLSKTVKHNPNKDETAYLTVEVKGIAGGMKRTKIISAAASSDYFTTAMVTAAIAKISLHKNVIGVVCPFEITNLDEIISIMKSSDLIIEEFVM